mmetsp:Transcript_24327/g.53564  ORF Transcript_24327/g.53564 Transcript_24327/m.53564 type:complete len:305 (-) Transcript_24327:166-1080(-)
MGCGASSRQKPNFAVRVVDSDAKKPSTEEEPEAREEPVELPATSLVGEPVRSTSRLVSPEKIRAIRCAFDAVDSNRNGTIAMDELSQVLDMLKKDGHNLTETEQEHLFQTIDKDQNGKVRYEEFLDWVLSQDDTSGCLAEWAVSEGILDLHRAAINGDAEQAKKLLAAGAKVGITDVRGVTPLHFACRRGYVDVAKELIEAGADVSLRTHLGRAPLHAAAEQGSVAMAKLLLDAKADLEAKDVRQQTPLHWAVRGSQVQAVQFLIDARADLTAKTVGGYTPFSMAEDWSSASMRELVKSFGGGR